MPGDVPLLMATWLAALNRVCAKPLSGDEALAAYARLHLGFVHIHPRCRPWRAKRRPVVPGRRRRERAAGGAQGPQVPEPWRRYAERIRHAVEPFVVGSWHSPTVPAGDSS